VKRLHVHSGRPRHADTYTVRAHILSRDGRGDGRWLMAEPCHDFRGVQVRPAGSRLHARIARRLGPIGTHIGILLPGLRPVIARFSAISHGAEHLCVGLLAA